MTAITLSVNGKQVSADIPGETLLSDFLRDTLRLTGTHIGCDTSRCGACVVHVDGRAVKSCTTLAAALDGRAITTIEGIAGADGLHPMQVVFHEQHALQCGFCTPGMIMSAIDMVNRYRAAEKELTAHAVREELTGNLCRCTGYQNIVKAIQLAAGNM